MLSDIIHAYVSHFVYNFLRVCVQSFYKINGYSLVHYFYIRRRMILKLVIVCVVLITVSCTYLPWIR